MTLTHQINSNSIECHSISRPRYYTPTGQELSIQDSNVQGFAKRHIQQIIETDWFQQHYGDWLFSDNQNEVRVRIEFSHREISLTLSNGKRLCTPLSPHSQEGDFLHKTLTAVNKVIPFPPRISSAAPLPAVQGNPPHPLHIPTTSAPPPTQAASAPLHNPLTTRPQTLPEYIPTDRYYTDDNIRFLLDERLRRSNLTPDGSLTPISANLHAGRTLAQNIQDYLAASIHQSNPPSHLYVPINLGSNTSHSSMGSHWVAMTIRTNASLPVPPHITYFDSLGGNSINRDVRSALEQIFRHDFTTEIASRPIQRDGDNCGPWCMAFLEAMIRYEDDTAPSRRAVDALREINIERRRREDERLIADARRAIRII